MNDALSTKRYVYPGGAWRYSVYFARRSYNIGAPASMGALDAGFRVFRRVT